MHVSEMSGLMVGCVVVGDDILGQTSNCGCWQATGLVWIVVLYLEGIKRYSEGRSLSRFKV
jgi:hypothetical protein